MSSILIALVMLICALLLGVMFRGAGKSRTSRAQQAASTVTKRRLGENASETDQDGTS